jgi:hypothetical protein
VRPDHSLGPAVHRRQSLADGWFYNPDDGKTCSISARLVSPDVIKARVYVGFPLFGETKTLLRVAHGTSEGWCGRRSHLRQATSRAGMGRPWSCR